MINGLLAALCAWLFVAMVLETDQPAFANAISSLAPALTAELFVVAGVLRLLCWRVTRLPASLHASIGPVCIGILVPAFSQHTSSNFDAPISGGVILLAAVAQLAAGRHAREARQAVTGLATVTAGASALCAGLVALGPSRVAVIVDIIVAVSWVALGAWRRSQAQSAMTTSVRLASAAMFVLSAGATLRLAALATGTPLQATSPGFEIVAGVLSVAAATWDLRRLHLAGRRIATRAATELSRVRAEFDDTRRTEQRRLHDARSALLGVMGATELLDSATPTPGTDAATLHRLIVAELRRLAAILEGENGDTSQEFDLKEALGPVLAAHSLASSGSFVADVASTRVRGSAAATATAMDNVLSNARRHAPGAAVHVSTRLDGQRVEVLVADDGPGVDPQDRVAVMRDGVRGSRATCGGSGIGLHSALSTLTPFGGKVELDESPSGGLLVVISLPRSDSSDMAYCA